MAFSVWIVDNSSPMRAVVREAIKVSGEALPSGGAGDTLGQGHGRSAGGTQR